MDIIQAEDYSEGGVYVVICSMHRGLYVITVKMYMFILMKCVCQSVICSHVYCI